jgi:hypothetical protein
MRLKKLGLLLSMTLPFEVLATSALHAGLGS